MPSTATVIPIKRASRPRRCESQSQVLRRVGHAGWVTARRVHPAPRHLVHSQRTRWWAIFPGVHHRAEFTVQESSTSLAVALRSSDGVTHVDIQADVASGMPADSVFRSLDEASAFFKGGSLGYSPTRRPGTYDGLELRTARWIVEPLAVRHVESTFFEDSQRFPRGAVTFDCALLMRDIEHEWHGRDQIRESA